MREYQTYDRRVLRLENTTLLEFIRDVEARHFRTENDTGAESNTLFIWNLVRQVAGLPGIAKTDLPAYCVDCQKYHQYPHRRMGKQEAESS